MFQFKLSAERTLDLASVLDVLTPSENAKISKEDMIKNNKMVEKLVGELQLASGPYAELMDKLRAKQRELAAKYQKQIDAVTETDEAKRNLLVKPIVDEANAENVKLTEAMDKELHFTEEAKKEVTVEIKSDERFQFLKECLSELGKKYNQRKAFVETVIAIEEAVEA